MSERFALISEKINYATGVTFEQVADIQSAKEQVESSEAYGLITVTDSGFDYFRSEFNEPEGGRMVRGLFPQRWISHGIEKMQRSGTVTAAIPQMAMVLGASAVLFVTAVFRSRSNNQIYGGKSNEKK